MIVPIILEIGGYLIAFTGIGLPVTAVAVIVGTILETISTVCNFVGVITDGSQLIEFVLGLVGLVPVIGIVPQVLRLILKVIL